ncbi:MAG TPA: O-antigen translocase [Paludibacteraceae bacterium]|nr:O-antigen translocase [Paludibacteraceae bacterium]
MNTQQSSYRQIMAATSLFGGVQVFQILIQIIRSKFVAVLLGPAGMGIVGLLTSTLGLISGLTNFGLGTSAVKDIAEARTTENETRIATVTIVLRRLVWISGTLGTIVVLAASPWLSRLTFGNSEYTLAYIWISISLLFNQLTSGQLVLLQGMRKLQYLAQANLFGSLLGLLITVPLYYKWGIDGIVPGIILTSVTSFLIALFFSNKISLQKVRVSKVRTIAVGRNMVTMGFMISLSGFISLGVSYLLQIFINRHGGVADVGLYNAGFTLINTYVGLIFTAMATDYYPRLSAIAHNNLLCKETINQQAEVALLILAPIVVGFLVFINWAIILLYSSKFIAVNTMVYWAALGMFFKAASWAIAFIFLAKGTSKLFFWNELSGNLYMLILNVSGYYFFGLTGLGISFLLGYLVYLIQVFVIAKLKFEFSFNSDFLKVFIIQFSLALSCFLAVISFQQPYPYIIGTVLLLISGGYSLNELEKRIGIKEIIKEFTHRNKTTDS